MKEWTVMVYMAGDNNLSENMAFSLDSLGAFRRSLAAGSESRINLLAFFDGSSLTAPTMYIDYSDLEPNATPFRQPVTPSQHFHPNEKDGKGSGEYPGKASGDQPLDENSASAYSIMNFVHWCIETQRRTARNYALIFSGHSFGFHGTSFLRDDSAGRFITLGTFRRSIEQINKLYFANQYSDRLAILGFDSCEMSMLEVGFELKDTAHTIVASEGSLPNSGWGYAPMLTEFVSSIPNTTDTERRPGHELDRSQNEAYVRNAARSFVTAFTDLQHDLALGGRSVDIAAWDLKFVSDLASDVGALARLFNDRFDLEGKVEDGVIVHDSIDDEYIRVNHDLKKILLQSHYDSQTYMEEQCVDLKDFCGRLIFECGFMNGTPGEELFREIRDRCVKVIGSIDRIVLKCGYSGDEFQFSNGISLYFPWSYVTYFLTDHQYRRLRFNRGVKVHDMNDPQGVGKDWNAFLRNYLVNGTLRRARKNPATGAVSQLEAIDNNNQPWSRNNPPWSKNNPPWSKNNPPWNKGVDDRSRDNPPWSRGEVGNYLTNFGRFKNFELRWDISGYSDEQTTDAQFGEQFDDPISQE